MWSSERVRGSWLNRGWWQSAAAGQAVAAGLRLGHSEEPDTLHPPSRSKCKYVR